MKPEDIDDFVVWAAIGIVLGGRVGYILFYDFARYLANPLDIFAVWQGGMSFHGGFAGTTLAMILFARSRGIRVWTLFDVVAAGVPVGARPRAPHQLHQFRTLGPPDRRCPGASSSPMAARSRAIPASSTRRCWRASCCSSSCAS